MIDTKALSHHMQGKVIQLDYDLITSLEGCCCYCLTDAQVQMILGISDYFGWVTRWYSSSGTIDKQTILDLQGGLIENLMSGCCNDGSFSIRFRFNGIVYEKSQDGGATWTPAPEYDPRLNSVLWPKPSEIGLPSTKCQAADSVSNYFKTKINEQVTDDMAAAAILGVVAAALLLLLSEGGTGFITAQIQGLVAAILAAGVSAWQAAFTSTVWNKLRCLIYNHMDTDETITQAGLDAVYSALDTTFTGIVVPTLKGYISAAGLVGINNIMSQLSGDPDANCDDCTDTCFEGWEAGYNYEGSGIYPFGAITDSDANWIIVSSADRGDGQQVIRITQPYTGWHECSVQWELIPTDYTLSNKAYGHSPNPPDYTTATLDPLMPSPRTANYMELLGGTTPFSCKFTFTTP